MDLDWGSGETAQCLGYSVSEEDPWVPLVGQCVQREVVQGESDETYYLHDMRSSVVWLCG